MLGTGECCPKDRLIVALDCPKRDAIRLGRMLQGRVGWVKVGMTLYYASGPDIVDYFRSLGFKVFLDLKLFDIPHQVMGAAASAAACGADLLSIHGLGGGAMVAAARKGADSVERTRRCSLVAITVLTSMDEQTMASVGIGGHVDDEVSRLAALACAEGADGIVCSPREAGAMRALLGPDALIVCPGVRPAGASLGDQSRVATPAAAVAAGASHLVVGRPITEAEDPMAAAEAIIDQIASALDDKEQQ